MAKKTSKKKVSASSKGTISAKVAAIFLFVLSASVYVNTLGHDFALDDSIVIIGNEFTKKGFDGIKDHLTKDSFTGFFGNERDLVAGGRYRPMSLIFFSVEYALFGENAGLGHFLNMLYYGMLVLLLYFWLFRLRRDEEHRWLSLPFIAAVLFAVHPLHTEVVANIKGRDDLFALLGSIGAAWFALKYYDYKKPLDLLWSGLLFFFGIMSKENTITFLAVIPMTLFFFRKPKISDYALTLAPAVLATIGFMILRVSVVGWFGGGQTDNLINNPFMEATVAERYGTTFYTLWRYIQLLFVPIGLTSDYYPYHIPLMDFTDWRVWLGIVANGALLIWALVGLPKKKITSFGVLYYFVTLSIVSNIPFTIGAFMNERFVFMSSVGWAIAVAAVLIHFLGSKEGSRNTGNLRYAVLGIALVFSVLTIARNRAWKDNFTIFSTDVKTSTNSCKAHLAYGSQAIRKAIAMPSGQERNRLLNEGIKHVEWALEIYPDYIEALSEYGTIKFNQGKIDEAIDLYLRCMDVRNNADNREVMLSNINYVFERVDQPKKYIDALERFMEYDTLGAQPRITVGTIYVNDLADYAKAEKYFREAAQLDPSSTTAWYNLGVVATRARNQELLEEAIRETSAREGETERVKTLRTQLNK